MTGGWKKFWTAALTGIALAGVVVACSGPDQGELTSEPQTQVGPEVGGPQYSPPPLPKPNPLHGTECSHSQTIDGEDPPKVDCINIYGDSNTTIPLDTTSFGCVGYGHYVSSPAFIGPTLAGHEFSVEIAGDPFIEIDSVDLTKRIFTVKALRPTRAGFPIIVRCLMTGVVQEVQDSIMVTITGAAPALDSISITTPGQNWVGIGEQLQLTPHSWDTYGFEDALDPAPTYSWTSSNRSKATIDGSTGLVTGVARGTATLNVSGGAVIRHKLITVVGCSALTLSPSGTYNFQYGASSLTVTATLTCDNHVDAGTTALTWTHSGSGVVTVTPFGTGNHSATVANTLPNEGGTETVTACVTSLGGTPCATLTVVSPPLIAGLQTLPNPVRAGVSCTWIAGAAGGLAPYSYAWTVDGNPVGTNSTSLTFSNFGSAFALAVTATDANNVSVTESLPVTIAKSGPNCSM